MSEVKPQVSTGKFDPTKCRPEEVYTPTGPTLNHPTLDERTPVLYTRYMGRKLSAKDAEKLRRRVEAKRKTDEWDGKYGRPEYTPVDLDDESCEDE